MEYQFPREFPREAIAEVMAARFNRLKWIKGERSQVDGVMNLGHLTLKHPHVAAFVEPIFEAFTSAACRSLADWRPDKIEVAVREFLRIIVLDAISECGPRGFETDGVLGTLGALSDDFRIDFESLPVWETYLNNLESLAVAQIDSPPSGPNGPPPDVSALLDVVSTRHQDRMRNLIRERNEKYRSVSAERLSHAGKAIKRIQIYQWFAELDVARWVESYRDVANEFQSERMLVPDSLQSLREQIKTRIRHGMQSVLELNDRAAFAAGERSVLSVPSHSASQMAQIESSIFDAANYKIRIIEAERDVRSMKGPPVVPRRIPHAEETVAPTAMPPQEESVSIGQQIESLRIDCKLTHEKLAEHLDITVRQVQRHVHDEALPQARHLGSYSRLFTQLLGRHILIDKKSQEVAKRQKRKSL